MSEIGSMEAKIPLGVGNLISKSFGLYFRKFIPFFLIAFIPTFLSALIQNQLLYDPAALQSETGLFTVGYFAAIFFGIVVWALTMGVITLAAYDTLTGRPIRLAGYIGIVLSRIVPIVVLSVVYYVIIMIGFMLLILPGIYLAVAFSLMVPAILIEGAGFGALGRSWGLTKNYRWPSIGGWIVFGLIILVLMTVATMVVGFGNIVAIGEGTDVGSLMFTYTLVSSVSAAIGYGLASVFGALLYARLREIKEGLSFDNLSDVFA